MTKLHTGLGLLTTLTATLVLFSSPCNSCAKSSNCTECTVYIEDGRIVKKGGVYINGTCVPCCH